MDMDQLLPDYPGKPLVKLLPSQMMNWANELAEIIHEDEGESRGEAIRYFESLGVQIQFFQSMDYGALVVDFSDLPWGRPLFIAQFSGYDAETVRVFPFLGFEEEH